MHLYDDWIQQDAVEIYRNALTQWRIGIQPPVLVEHDDTRGFIVKAAKRLKPYTLLAEYAGT